MRFKVRSLVCVILGATIAASAAHADEVEGLITFTAGTPAKASEVNDNFAAVKTAVDGTHADVVALQQAVAEIQEALEAQATQLTALQTANATLTAAVAALETENATLTAAVAALETENATLASQLDDILNSQVMALADYLTITDDPRPTILLSGVNLQIVNGLGSTATSNGLGNLIVGYDEPNPNGTPVCSLGERVNDEAGCTTDNGVWDTVHKRGSHYVVVGAEHNYSRYGGIVSGLRNNSLAPYASVTGGSANWALNFYASVTGGDGNRASGRSSSVSGGSATTASAVDSSVSGGISRQAAGPSNWAAGSLYENF